MSPASYGLKSLKFYKKVFKVKKQDFSTLNLVRTRVKHACVILIYYTRYTTCGSQAYSHSLFPRNYEKEGFYGKKQDFSTLNLVRTRV